MKVFWRLFECGLAVGIFTLAILEVYTYLNAYKKQLAQLFNFVPSLMQSNGNDCYCFRCQKLIFVHNDR